MNKLRVLDLFSGIGGFSLGLERTGGFETVAFCEIEEFPCKVLAKHWPGVPIYEDVKELTAERLRADGIGVDVITGGFPCQDLSASGKKGGIEAERSGLWGQIIRLAVELGPQFIFVENVTNLLVGPREQPGAWFGKVLGDLAEIGFDAEWDCIQASAIGAPHGRDRVWLVAYPNQVGRTNSPLGLDPFRQLVRGVKKDLWSSEPPEAVISGVDDGFPDWVDRRAALGNAVVPQIPEMIGHAILQSMRAA
jgi:DNA (cytosine-5)-methyltransferase 1